tara:strand:- start:1027 stop:1524 length:498 start_codon:yes stop_codon:yes gene_type:complete
MKFLTVDNEIATIKNNKVISPGSRFDGMDIKTNEDIEKIFGVKVGKKDLSTYKKTAENDLMYGDSGEQRLYEDAVKAYRGEIKGPRAMKTMDAVQGEFPASIMDRIRQDAVKPRELNMPALPAMGPLGTREQTMNFRNPSLGRSQAKSTPMNFRKMLLANLTGLL